MESNFKRIILPVLVAVAIGAFAYVYSTSNNYTIITDQSVATDKIIVSDYAKVRDENLVKTCDVVVARDPSMAADIYCLDDDCSDEIQSAIDYVASKGGGVVCIRRGEYPVKNTIILKSNITLQGDSKNTIIKNYINTSGNAYIIKNEHAFTTSQYDKNIALRDLVIDYNYYHPQDPYYPFVAFHNIKNLRIENVELKNHYGDGGHYIQICAAENVYVRNVKIYSAKAYIKDGRYYGADGLSLGECIDGEILRSVRNAIVTDVWVYDTIDDAILISAGQLAQNITLSNFIIYKNGYAGSGIDIYGGKNIVIKNGIIFDSSDAHALAIRRPTEDVIVSNVKITTKPWLGDGTVSPISPANSYAIYCINSKRVLLNNIDIEANSTDHTIFFKNCTETSMNNVYVKQLDRVNSASQTIRITTNSEVFLNRVTIEDDLPETNYNILTDSSSFAIISNVYFKKRVNTAIDFGGPGIIENVLNATAYLVNQSITYCDFCRYTILPTCSTDSIFNGRTITYYDGTNYNRCTCIDGSWKCMQLS